MIKVLLITNPKSGILSFEDSLNNVINQFKKYMTKPRCIDLNFSNRYSICLIKPPLNKIQGDIANLALRFYNDAYFMDQQGCSSPQAVIWLTKEKKCN